MNVDGQKEKPRGCGNTAGASATLTQVVGGGVGTCFRQKAQQTQSPGGKKDLGSGTYKPSS